MKWQSDQRIFFMRESRKLSEAKLLQAMNAADGANAGKSVFLSNISMRSAPR